MSSVKSLPAPACRTCFFWEHRRRGRTCRSDKKVQLGDRKVTGTPPDYWCKDYKALTHARCGDCVHWSDERLPRKKSPCSQLALIDDRGKERTSESTFCKHFNQKPSVSLHNNNALRVDGHLATVIDLNQHSHPVPLVIRSSDNSGMLLKWDPHGPGVGQWVVLPIELTEDGGMLQATQHQTGDVKAQTDVLFSGSAIVTTGTAVRTLYGHAARAAQNAISSIIFRVQARRKRGVSEEVVGESVEFDAAKRVQDEPWGPDWEDLVEQMESLLDVGVSPSKAAKKVRREWSRDASRKLGPKTAARLEAQLKVEFRG